ncbi:hypothetical protein [Granulicella sp. S190]|uniref:hypothetical protein n=1 Tax=Granulicella sp. S190 TaxID=1747226 RepID=UPI00131D2278|nr:hypothetical protein [Granulicella sp. S190]
MQLPADQRAFAAARATVDPEQRLVAMQKFLEAYPKSSSASRAQGDIFDTLLKYFPQRTAEIDTQARLLIKNAGKGLSRLNYETYVADSLAEANEVGVDLPRAEKLAKDAVNKYTEASFDKGYLAAAKQYKQPAPTSAALHSSFASDRASALAALAKVEMDEHNPPSATALLTEAYSLNPNVDEVNLLRGELALDQHKDAEALEDFERAQLTGELKSPWRERMMELYRNAHNGSDQGFLSEMDAQYARIFPEPFSPQPHKPADTKRTALLELFTGSACEPCVAADLAVDTLLKTYPRSELIVLAYDQHIPEPDPLANPDSVARAKSYGVHFTPTSMLNGKPLWEGGGSRSSAEKTYDEAIKKIDATAAQPSGVQILLTAHRGAGDIIHANATVSIGNPEQLKQALAPDPPDQSVSNKTPVAAPAQPGPTAQPVPTEPHLVTNFALVEDEVRYSGENGIRFHRMVVRALSQPAPEPIGSSKTLDATFDPATISTELKSYLDSFEQKNDRFGKIQFLSKDTTLEPSHLAVAAWVEDTTTHRVLQSAFVPLSTQSQTETTTGSSK